MDRALGTCPEEWFPPIAGAIAAFISITALVGDTNFPQRKLGPTARRAHSVRIAEPSQPPCGPIAVAAPPTLMRPRWGSPPARVGRPRAQRGHGPERLRYRRPPRGRLAECRSGRGGTQPGSSGGGGGTRLSPVGGNGSPPSGGTGPSAPPSARPRREALPAHVRWRPAGEHAAVRGNRPPSTPRAWRPSPAGSLQASPRSPAAPRPGWPRSPAGSLQASPRSPAGFRPARPKRAEPSHFRPRGRWRAADATAPFPSMTPLRRGNRLNGRPRPG